MEWQGIEDSEPATLIDLPFDPNIALLGPLTLSWHGIFTVVGIYAGVWLAVRLARKRVPEGIGYSVATWGVVGGVIGARLFHVIDDWDYYARDPLQIVALWNGGIAIRGAVIGGILFGFVRGRQLDVPVGFGADAAAPGIAIGTALGRIGDIINGEHHAAGCSGLSWCVRYTNAATLGQGPYHAPPAGFEAVHPAVAYEMLFLLLLTGALLWLRPRLGRLAPPGLLFWLFLLAYGLEGFFLGFLRLDPVVLFGLRQQQLLSLALVGASAGALGYLAQAQRGGQQGSREFLRRGGAGE